MSTGIQETTPQQQKMETMVNPQPLSERKKSQTSCPQLLTVWQTLF